MKKLEYQHKAAPTRELTNFELASRAAYLLEHDPEHPSAQRIAKLLKLAKSRMNKSIREAMMKVPPGPPLARSRTGR